jgi:hypothetical protein
MNLVINIDDFNLQYISFLDLKKNNIIEGNFSKIIYSDSNVSCNGIFLHFKMILHNNYLHNEPAYKMYFVDFNSLNINISKQLLEIEDKIIKCYKETYKIQKTSFYSLKNQLIGGVLKVHNSPGILTIPEIIKPTTPLHYIPSLSMKKLLQMQKSYLLKISGIWENKTSVGITYKIIEIF